MDALARVLLTKTSEGAMKKLPNAAEACRQVLLQKVRDREFIEADFQTHKQPHLLIVIDVLDREIIDLRRSLVEFEGDCEGR